MAGERRARGRLDADEPDLGAQGVERDRGLGGDRRRRPGSRPSPAGGQLSRELEPECPLPCDDPDVVEGVDERLRSPPSALCDRERLVESLARELDLGAVAARSVDLAIGAPSGTKIVAEIPACRAAQATAWPWFPALAVSTPRPRSSADSWAIVL